MVNIVWIAHTLYVKLEQSRPDVLILCFSFSLLFKILKKSLLV